MMSHININSGYMKLFYSKSSKSNHAGFTLIELLVVLAIVVLLMSYGLPSFQNFSARQKLTNLANELIGDLNFTRVQAISQGTKVTLSAVGGDWNNGWSIDQTMPDGSIQQIRVKQVLSSNPSYVVSGTAVFEYDSLGSASIFGSVLIEKPPEYLAYITLTVSPSGTATSSRSL